ncbi:hypothetical protein MBLNU459_g5987t1 [Dothideomycetes sp. NU459]
MPPKKSTAKEHHVYIIMRYEFDGDDEVASETIVHQAHATLEAANENAINHFEMLAQQLKSSSVTMTNRNLIRNDGTFQQRTEPNTNKSSQLSNRTIEVEVIKKDLFGGTITPIHPAKTPTPKKAPAKKTVVPRCNDDEFDGDDLDQFDESTYGTHIDASHAKTLDAGASKKRKVFDNTDADSENTRFSAPPSGCSNALEGLSFFVSGTLERWTRVQAHALIEFYSGSIEKSLKTTLDYVVLGYNAGQKKLDVVMNNTVALMDQEDLWKLIETCEGEGGPKLDPAEVDKACRPPLVKKGVKKAKKA